MGLYSYRVNNCRELEQLLYNKWQYSLFIQFCTHDSFFLKQDIASQNNDKYGSCLIEEITDKEINKRIRSC